MTDEQTQPGRLARLLARVRRAEPKRPRWWHFAPHVVVVMALIPLEFFFVPIQDRAATSWRVASLMLPWVIEQVVFPVSLVRGLWRCFRLGWRQGTVWLGRPALLVLALLVIHSPLRRQGQIWDFEKRLPRYNELVAYVLEQHPEPLGPNEGFRVPLPKGYEGLTHDGEVRVLGHPGGMEMMFLSKAGADLYIIGQPPNDVGGHVRYGEHWYLSSRSNFILDALTPSLLVAVFLLPPLRDAYSFVMRIFHFL
jgi:hypothetical protein